MILKDLEKICFILIKITLADQLKIIDNKIEANQGQYYLDSLAAKISALKSKNLLGKYKYLTGEDLEYKPSVVEKTKFEYSPLGIVFTNNTKSKTKKNKVDNKKKTRQVFNSQHKFVKFKNIDEL